MAEETREQDSASEEQASTEEQKTERQEERTYSAAEVKELRDEAARRRTELRKAEARLKELEDAKLSETEKKDRDLKAALDRAEAAERRVRGAEIQAAAAAAGAINPARVARLIDEGEEDAEKAVQALKKSDPYLFGRPGAGSADGGAGGSGVKPGDMNTLIRRAAGRD